MTHVRALGVLLLIFTGVGCSSDDPATVEGVTTRNGDVVTVEFDAPLTQVGAEFYTEVDGDRYALSLGGEGREPSYMLMGSRNFSNPVGVIGMSTLTLRLPPETEGSRQLVCSESDMTGTCFWVDG